MHRVVEVKEREEELAPPRAAQHREEGGTIYTRSPPRIELKLNAPLSDFHFLQHSGKARLRCRRRRTQQLARTKEGTHQPVFTEDSPQLGEAKKGNEYNEQQYRER
jgi:hypothetical protein